MPQSYSVMIKPASSLCNMRCRYCFYADVSSSRKVASFGIMSTETSEKIIAKLMESVQPRDSLTIAFQGGEPTLAGLDYFRHFTQTARHMAGQKNVRLHWAFQTNGYVLNDEWCRFFKENHFLAGLSLDLLDHDENRLDPEGKGTQKRVWQTKGLLEKHQVEYNVLCVLTNGMARHPKQVWQALQKNNIQYVQFIPCLDDFEQSGLGFALTPQRFASFYNALAKLWFDSYRAGRYTSVKFFDDTVNLIARGTPTACGQAGRCSAQFVVEADGGVYPCDFYVLDDGRAGNLTTDTLQEIFSHPVMRNFLEPSRTLPPLCRQCEFIRLCNGGCKRMENAMYWDPGQRFCGYQSFLRESGTMMEQVARFVSSPR